MIAEPHSEQKRPTTLRAATLTAIQGHEEAEELRVDEAAHDAGMAAQSKMQFTLIAALALHGHEVHTLARGGFLVCRWGQTRGCPSLEALQAFARQVGAVR